MFTDTNRQQPLHQGARVFELVAVHGEFDHDHYVILLDVDAGALEIPGVYHRSTSCESGSILLNHAVRDDQYCEKNEFNPTGGCQDPLLAAVLLRNDPIYINGSKEEIECFLETGSMDKCLIKRVNH